MQNIYTAVVEKNDDRWIGWIEEAPHVNCREHTLEELLKTLRVNLREAREVKK
jgi:predicted nucleic acid-binding OB-fold protein